MENENIKNKILSILPSSNQNKLPFAIVIAGILIAGAVLYKDRDVVSQSQSKNIPKTETVRELSNLEKLVLPVNGVVLPVSWGDLGAKLVSVGAIDADKLKSIYDQRGTFSDEYRNLLFAHKEGKLTITQDNAGYLLNLFWALGLASKNPILDSGEMNDPKYGGAGRFASTGGWTIAKGNPMDHYSKHRFFNLTPEQQETVDRVSRGIYRPCCNNSTHFPDCNHGMAMLGLLELMASQNVSEQDMWEAALAVNSYWFPDTYLTIATYMKNKSVEWKDVNPQEMLGIDYSSASGYRKIATQIVEPLEQRGGNGCGVDVGQPAPVSTRQQSGCGI